MADTKAGAAPVEARVLSDRGERVDALRIGLCLGKDVAVGVRRNQNVIKRSFGLEAELADTHSPDPQSGIDRPIGNYCGSKQRSEFSLKRYSSRSCVAAASCQLSAGRLLLSLFLTLNPRFIHAIVLSRKVQRQF